MSIKSSFNSQVAQAYDTYSERWDNENGSAANFLKKYIETPAIRPLIPDVHGKRVLCIGCGTGDECEYMHSLGARYVLGTDISPKLIKIAKNQYPHLPFETHDFEDVMLREQDFDLIYSSLVFHYIHDWNNLFKKLYAYLKDSGIVVFSVWHPIKTSFKKMKNESVSESMLGYKKSLSSSEVWGDYLNRHDVHDTFFDGTFPIEYTHRSLSSMLQVIQESGLHLETFLEPLAVPQGQIVNVRQWDIYQRIPSFAVFRLRK